MKIEYWEQISTFGEICYEVEFEVEPLYETDPFNLDKDIYYGDQINLLGLTLEGWSLQLNDPTKKEFYEKIKDYCYEKVSR